MPGPLTADRRHHWIWYHADSGDPGQEELELLDRAAKAEWRIAVELIRRAIHRAYGTGSGNGSPRSTTAVARGEDGTSPATSMSTLFRATSTGPTYSNWSDVKLIDTTIAVGTFAANLRRRAASAD